jgi:vancomycin resistance protein YoaR
MKVLYGVLAGTAALIVAGAGVVVATPLVFAGRVLPGTSLGPIDIGGLRHDALDSALDAFEEGLRGQEVELVLRDERAATTLGELGVGIDRAATINRISALQLPALIASRGTVAPPLMLAPDRLDMSIARLFPGALTAPQNASLSLSGVQPLTLIKSRRGERVNSEALLTQVNERLRNNAAVELTVVEEAAAVQDTEVEEARRLASQLLAQGLTLSFADQSFTMTPATVQRLLVFAPRTDPHDPANQILGVKLDAAGLETYLSETLVPVIDQPAQNARFVLSEEETEPGSASPEIRAPEQRRVTQFSLPQMGQMLNIPRTMSHVSASLDAGRREAPLAVDVTSPQVGSLADIEQLGLTSLLARGESDFAGSPKNRIHNITVGTSRYHGLLIAPNQEFSFNEFLGPVDRQHGFLPELVIKHNVTTPEYGGGLCQVSTTAFRAALNAGLAITARRNHAYAVRYYGTPGLDATIYPPSTDLKFRNNTPGYILVQTNITGTKLTFEFWGTNDGRTVEVAGPVTYNRQANGAVSAYVDQKVMKDGQALIEERFYSRYRSPQLFPKVLAANGEANSQ